MISIFYSLTGKLVFADINSVAVDCGGVAYRCYTTMNTRRQLPAIGQTATLYTYLGVKEDALTLYGFADDHELSFFKLLIGVSGVGPKAALAILSELSPEKLALCIASGDAKTITRAQGVGARIAQRVVLELKEKVGSLDSSAFGADIAAAGTASASGNAADAVAALTALGYPQSEASLAVGRLDSALPAEQLIKDALKTLGRGKL